MDVRPWIRSARAALTILLLLGVPSPLAAQTPTASLRMDRFEEWLAALARHTPGEVDDALLAFAAWRPVEWQVFILDATTFARTTIRPGRWTMYRAGRWQVSNDLSANRSRVTFPTYDQEDAARMRALVCAFGAPSPDTCGPIALTGDTYTLWVRGRAARERGDPYYVLRLAALLHADLVSWGGTQETAPQTGSSTTTRLRLDIADGQGGLIREFGIQWQIAYLLLDAMLDGEIARTGPPLDPWVRDWYVATGRWMQREGMYDQAHIEHALLYFPNDPELRFLSATLHEIDAGPIMQHAMRSLQLPYGVVSNTRGVRDELGDAAAELRRVLRVRPDWLEAELRLGRVLMQLGEPTDATAHLQFVLDHEPEALLEYFAALFLGSIQQDAGRLDDAERLYRRALALYPAAQSPFVALSTVANQRGDRAGAWRTMQQALALGDSPRDPWWDYLNLQARDVDDRLDALRRPVVNGAR